MRRSRKPLRVVRLVEGSNPSPSALLREYRQARPSLNKATGSAGAGLRSLLEGENGRPGQSFGVYADNEEGVGLTSEADLGQLFVGLACSLGDALEARRA